MSTPEELRKQVRVELSEALKFTGRAANLLRHEDWDRGATKAAEALEQITGSMTEHIDNLLSR